MKIENKIIFFLFIHQLSENIHLIILLKKIKDEIKQMIINLSLEPLGHFLISQKTAL
jgi:hypothetical protein